ncbi:MAG: ACT domain-containing protein, partial [bacterium]
IYVKGNMAGELMFYGQGAGSRPTGSAVVSDIIALAKAKIEAPANPSPIPKLLDTKMLPIAETISKYYLRMKTPDKPGVLADIASVFGKNNVSIRYVLQTENIGDAAQIVIVVHETKESNFRKALGELNHLDSVIEVSSVIRVGLD